MCRQRDQYQVLRLWKKPLLKRSAPWVNVLGPEISYDVINLFRNTEARPQSAVLHDVLKQKCAHRGIPVPTFAELEIHRDDLGGSWQSMLTHQLQALPPVESFWSALPDFFDWLETGVVPTCLPAHLPDGCR